MSAQARLFAEAERLAGNIRINQPVLNFLYARSRCGMSRDEWEREIRIACAIDRIVYTSYPGLGLGDLIEMIDRAADAKALATLNPSKGKVLLTFHGAYVAMARKVFVLSFANGMILTRLGTLLGSTATANPREALFTAMRGLQEGRALFIGPDGPDGRQRGTLNVLGTVSTAGDGAAYLAHTADCDVAWFTVVRDGQRFVPIIEVMPGRSPGESLKAFSDRLFQFYSEKIEANFTGHPQNIVFRPRWSRLFQAIEMRR